MNWWMMTYEFSCSFQLVVHRRCYRLMHKLISMRISSIADATFRNFSIRRRVHHTRSDKMNFANTRQHAPGISDISSLGLAFIHCVCHYHLINKTKIIIDFCSAQTIEFIHVIAEMTHIRMNHWLDYAPLIFHSLARARACWCVDELIIFNSLIINNNSISSYSKIPCVRLVATFPRALVYPNWYIYSFRCVFFRRLSDELQHKRNYSRCVCRSSEFRGVYLVSHRCVVCQTIGRQRTIFAEWTHTGIAQRTECGTDRERKTNGIRVCLRE